MSRGNNNCPKICTSDISISKDISWISRGVTDINRRLTEFFYHVSNVLSVAKVLLPLICFRPLSLENGKRYDKNASYQVDRYLSIGFTSCSFVVPLFVFKFMRIWKYEREQYLCHSWYVSYQEKIKLFSGVFPDTNLIWEDSTIVEHWKNRSNNQHFDRMNMSDIKNINWISRP